MLKIRLTRSRKHDRYRANRRRWQEASTLSLVVCFMFVLAGCSATTDDPAADHSFLTQRPCTAPCWYGLELDKSSKDDVYATLRTLPFIDQNTIKEWKSSWLNDENAEEVYFSCLHPDTKFCGGALISQGKLKQLRMSIGYDLTFDMVIQRLGIPAYISYHPDIAEAGVCIVSLYWPTVRIQVDSYSKQDKLCQKLSAGAGVDPQSTVGQIIYRVTEGFSPGLESGWPYAPWPGFAKP